MLDTKTCQQARLSRDARFDGQFFIGVKTTGIYCRCVCPANAPKEENIDYYPSPIAAAKAGFRPCLRCRPDSAPHSPAWKGVSATFERALRLINQGALENDSLKHLAHNLGISDRYLRELFNKHIGVSPKKYALYQQCLFAKQLLHQTQLPVTEVALASGFKSLRRFNDCLLKQLHLNPTQIRKKQKETTDSIELLLNYRPPYDWKSMQQFLQARVINQLEWTDLHSYGRTFELNGAKGQFTARHLDTKNAFAVDIKIDDLSQLKNTCNNIRRILDLDVDIKTVTKHLSSQYQPHIKIQEGLRLPGTWSLFEAGIRAILGQQISVQAAKNLVTTLVDQLGEKHHEHRTDDTKLFPTAEAIVNSELDFFKMPGSRKQTLKNLAEHVLKHSDNDPNTWLELKGIGPWTVDYAKMRGLSDPDVFLGGDLGVKKALASKNVADLASDKTIDKSSNEQAITSKSAQPWRSYLTFQLWNQL